MSDADFLRVLDLFEQHSATIEDRFAARIIETVPRYRSSDRAKLAGNVRRLVASLLTNLRDGQLTVVDEVLELAGERAHEGFDAGEFLRAIYVWLPVLRRFFRESGGMEDPALARGFGILEERLHALGLQAADAFATALQDQLAARNRELTVTIAKLKAKERELAKRVASTSTALQSAEEFNRRVLDSLLSGLLVVDSETLEITQCTPRLAEILETTPDRVIGHPVKNIPGIELDVQVDKLIGAIRRRGRAPATKQHVTLASGTNKALLIRGSRMVDEDGQPIATVLTVDDQTVQDLLIDSFRKYVSGELVERLLVRGDLGGLQGEMRASTVMFADIRGFTTLAEKQSPQALHEILNSYFQLIVPPLEEHGGFIDKFIGDNAMALFHQGSPDLCAKGAVRAALDIQARIAAAKTQRAKDGLESIEVGIGICSGDVFLGNIGTERRMDFTAIGDVVNVADRLQGLAEPGTILVDPKTAALLGNGFRTTPGSAVPVKGRAAPVQATLIEGLAD